MAPKKAEVGKKAEVTQELSPSALELLLPIWNDATLPQDVKGSQGQYGDQYGTAMLSQAQEVVTTWKRPAELLSSRATVPVVVAGSPDSGSSDNRACSARLFAGHRSLEWLRACFSSIQKLNVKLPQGNFLWELIHPQVIKGQPANSQTGKYHVKCFVMDQWRQVTVDDRIPVDAFGSPVLVGSMPLQLWPLLLSKAVLKLMSLYQVLETDKWHEVSAFQWLTGWPQENLLDLLHGPSLTGAGLFDRLQEACTRGVAAADEGCMTVAELKEPEGSLAAQPRLLVVCCPSGLGLDPVMQGLLEGYPNSLCRVVSHTSRVPLEDEQQGVSYTFTPGRQMQTDIDAGLFLESNNVAGPHGAGLFGVSFAAIAEAAATGRMGVVRMDMQGVHALQSNPQVQAIYVYLGPISVEEWAQQQASRLKESESTFQKRLAWAQGQTSLAAGLGLFDFTLQDTTRDEAYIALKEALATLSPEVRHRLKGVQAEVLDYADLIVSSSVESAVLKPVVLAGPSLQGKQELAQRLVREFPKVFQIAPLHCTPEYGQDDQINNAAEDALADHIVSANDFQGLVDQGQLVEHHVMCPVCHDLVRRQAGTSKAAIAAIVSAGRIPLLLTDVEGARQAKAAGQGCITLFLAPVSAEAFEAETRAFLARPEQEVQEQIAATKAEWEQVQSSSSFDQVIVHDDVKLSCNQLVELLTRQRPDVMAGSEQLSLHNSKAAAPPLQAPLVLASVAGTAAEALTNKLLHEHPAKFGTALKHTSRKPEKGEVEGVNFSFVKKEVLQKMIDAGQMAEWQEGAGGNLTGTALATVQQVAADGKMCILNLDVKRAMSLTVPNALKALIDPRGGLAEAVKGGLPPGTKEPQIQQAIEAATADIHRAKDKAGGFQATIAAGNIDTMYITLRRAISKHSPAIIPPTMTPLVLAAPFGAACQKAHLLQWLLKENGEKVGVPDMVTTKPKRETPEAHANSHSHSRNQPEPEFKVITHEEAEHLQKHGDFLIMEEVQGHIYGVTKAAVQAVQYQNKLCIVDVDHAEVARTIKHHGFQATYIGLQPESNETMLHNIETHVAEHPLPGYEPEDAAALMFQAAEVEVASLQKPGTVDLLLSVGLGSGGHLRGPYYQLLEQISLRYPQAVPMTQVWGYGQASWDVSSRQYGHKPFKVMVLGPPLSGKSSQCQLMSHRLGLPHIQVGALLQAKSAAGDEALQSILQGGGLVPDSMYIDAVRERLHHHDCLQSGWLLDGFPHTLAQAEALQAAGVIPDQVVLLDATEAVLLDRAKYRRIDPVSHHIYHVPPASGALSPAVTPNLHDGSPDAAAAARLVPRGDDTIPNVERRLAAWHKHARSLRKKYADVSSQVSAMGDISKITLGMVDSVLAEHKLSKDINIVPCSSLTAPHLQVMYVTKWRGKQIAAVQDRRQESMHVLLEDLASCSQSISIAQDPSRFAYSQQMKRADLRLLGNTPALFVTAKEPVDIMLCLAGGPDAEPPTHPNRPALGYQLVVEPHQWGSTAPAAPLLRLQTPTGAAARLALPAGRHLARLVTNLDRLHALDLRSNAPFQMADINTVLQEQEGLAVQRAEGRAGPYPPGAWALWFRYTFKLAQPCRLGLDLGLPGEALLKGATLVLLDNDTSQSTEYVMHRTKPTLLKGNKEGYTVLALSQCRQEMPSDTWRLCLVSEQPLQAWNQVPSSRQELYEGKYDANQQLILARYVVAPSQRTLLTMHAEVSTGEGHGVAGCKVCIQHLTDTAAQWHNNNPILGHWSGESQLTVAGQWLEAGKYLVQLALDPAFCRCQINAEGRLSCEASWKVQLLPSLEAKLCPITSDDSKAKWSQTAFAKWAEGQKDRPKQANTSMEAHKARAAAAAGKQQQAEAVTLKPVKKGEKKAALELHPDQFVRIKARKAEVVDSEGAAADMDKLDLVADDDLNATATTADIEAWKQARAENKAAMAAASQAQVADFASWRGQQLSQVGHKDSQQT